MNRPKEWVRLNCERILRPRAGEEKSEEWKRGDSNCRPVLELWFRPGVRESRLRFLSQASSIRVSLVRRQNLRGSGSIPGRACAIHRSPAESARVELRVSEK